MGCCTGDGGNTETVNAAVPTTGWDRPRPLAGTWASGTRDEPTGLAIPCEEDMVSGSGKTIWCDTTAASRRVRAGEEGPTGPIGSAIVVICGFCADSVSVFGGEGVTRRSRGKPLTSFPGARRAEYLAGIAASCVVADNPLRTAPATKVNSCKEITRSLTLVAASSCGFMSTGQAEPVSRSRPCPPAAIGPGVGKCVYDFAVSA